MGLGLGSAGEGRGGFRTGREGESAEGANSQHVGIPGMWELCLKFIAWESEKKKIFQNGLAVQSPFWKIFFIQIPMQWNFRHNSHILGIPTCWELAPSSTLPLPPSPKPSPTLPRTPQS